ncbi:hypothetical protein SAMN04488030_1432 [Aliiroseovarius halocynthiae]|uniref:hypothetical protein n=1 Tax=Aliiroseovarius halocynthiae TaxID=985055 RepID=UPI00163D3F03|nr:hypothetical protein [Aliiroseovarius halocynthiae]SMR72086.1 hypothetical protein SAMN04488030_1432 [Aliiroseovarius halocynthiae]
MITILSDSFRTATRLERQTGGQKRVFRDERELHDDRQAQAKAQLKRWRQRWFAG